MFFRVSRDRRELECESRVEFRSCVKMKTRRRGQMSDKSAWVRVQVCESGVVQSLAGMSASRFAKKEGKNISGVGRFGGTTDGEGDGCGWLRVKVCQIRRSETEAVTWVVMSRVRVERRKKDEVRE